MREAIEVNPLMSLKRTVTRHSAARTVISGSVAIRAAISGEKKRLSRSFTTASPAIVHMEETICQVTRVTAMNTCVASPVARKLSGHSGPRSVTVAKVTTANPPANSTARRL